MSNFLKIRPYARLLTMLGDQLIKNEQIAVIELIKNSYDANADWVKVSFENFGDNCEVTPDSKIIIEDNGTGMDKDTIENSWMNPATPNKFSPDGEIRKTEGGRRIIQGEKGIGRYAMLKLGRTVQLTTRSQTKPESSVEYSLKFDLSPYDDNFLSIKGKQTKLYLDDLNFELQTKAPEVIVNRKVCVGNLLFTGNNNEHGTRIEIRNLRGSWNNSKIKSITDSFVRFSNLFDEIIYTTNELSKQKDVFVIGLYKNGEQITKDASQNTVLQNLLESKTVLQIKEGYYNSTQRLFSFTMNGTFKTISLDDSFVKGIRVFKEHFSYQKENKKIVYREISAFGNFSFDFYIFDFNAKEPSKHTLTPIEKEKIKNHRIYLLRDEIRVLPYGDPNDDWLQIDIGRGTISAGSFFSNDQIVGRVKISKFGNPHLKDKTNREGLIDDENYTSDFICVIRTLLSYLRSIVYKQYLDDQKRKKILDEISKKKIFQEFEDLTNYFSDDKSALALIAQLKKSYQIEHKYLEERANRTESLAAVGLSVETSSHDMMLMMNRGLDELMNLMNASTMPAFDISSLSGELQKILGIFSYVGSRMKDMQMLFTSSKQRRRNIRVKDILDNVNIIYARLAQRSGIKIDIKEIGSPLVAKCTDADILQLLINLFDNAIYWLDVCDVSDKHILITLDGNNLQLLFSDNGCGVRDEDAPYIFEPFYSGKGEEGRGLGLYISKKLMERNDYSIRLAEFKDERILCGANFVVSFIKQENEY